MGKEVQEINRIVYIEPNEFAEMSQKAENGVSRDNISWNPEDLQFTVDLQVEKCSRFDESGNGKEKNTTVRGSWGSFMSGENLNTDTDGSAINCLTDAYTNISYTEYTSTGQSSRELLGIDSIDIDFSSHFYPQVKMKMTDVRGASLFQPAEHNYQTDERNNEKDKDKTLSESERENQKEPHLGQSFFKSLFHFPYPRFLLTLKGFYGDKVTFVLAVSDFKSAFNSQTGNFDVNVSFIGYMYGLYTDIPMNLVFASPYYNREYWDSKTKKEFTTYEGDALMTFPEFVEKYALLLKNINSSELGERENIVELKKLNDEYQEFTNLLNKYEITVKKVFGDKSSYKINGNSFNVYLYKKSDDVNGIFTNHTDSIKTFNSFLDDSKKKHPEYTWLNNFTFPNDASKITNVSLKIDDKFNPTLKDKLASEPNIIGLLQTYSEKNDGQVCIFTKSTFESELKDHIKNLESSISNLKNKTDKDIEEIITKALGFKMSVENVYRMIFAHIETFINSFETCCNNIEKDRQDGLRRAAYLGLNSKNSDLPKGKTNGDTFVPPFPAILEEDRRMIFPGYSNNATVQGMKEVTYVNDIVEAVTEYATKMEKAVELLNQQTTETNESDNESSFNLKFTPISVADIFYAIKNEHPYQFLDEYMSNTEHGYKAEYLLYFIYCRIMTAYGVNWMKEDKKNLSVSVFQHMCEVELNNCLSYFEEHGVIFDETLKGELNNLLDEIISKDGEVTGTNFQSYFTKYDDKLYTITNDVKPFEERGFSLYFTDPFNFFKSSKNDEYNYGTGRYISNEGFIHEKYYDLNNDSKSLRDFCTTLNETLGFEDKDSRFRTFEEGYKEKESQYTYTRIRNAEEGKYNTKDGRKYFILSSNTKIATKESNNANEDDKKKYINLDITKNDENLDSIFLGMTDNYNNNGDEGLKNYYTGLLSYGCAKDSRIKSLFLENKFEEVDSKKSLAVALINKSVNDKDYDRIAAILFLSSMATYFGKTYKRRKLLTTSINEIPEILLLYAGAMTYFYKEGLVEKLGEFKDYIGSDVYEYITDRKIEFVDKYRVALENNWPQTPYHGYSYASDILDAGFNNEPRERSEEFADYVFYLFRDWYDGEWGNIKSVLLRNGDYIGEIDDNHKQVPMWAYDSEQDRLIKKLLCKTRKFCFFNKKENANAHVYALGWSLDNLYMKTLMTVIKNTFAEYKTQDDRNAEEIKNATNSSTHEDFKTALYYTLKNLYDRWLGSQLWPYFKLQDPGDDKEERNNRHNTNKGDVKSEFNSFLYVNAFYKDISSRYVINPQEFVNCIMNYTANDKLNKNNSVYEFMAEVAEKNKLLMLALPVYNNFYNLETIKSIFTPNVLYAQKNKNMQKELGIGNTYLIMYTGEPSSKLGDDEGDYQDDAVDLFGMSEDHSPDTYKLFAKESENKDIDNSGEKNGEFTVPAFGVTYAKQNQMYFKNITVNMDNPQVTDYSLANLIQISYGGAHGDVNQRFGVGQNIYSIYSNRSYTCTVEMMGCMNIMPSMYFQLNNIPMFRGLYFIIKVSHSVQAGNMITKFTGVRINKNQLAECKLSFDFQSIYDKINGMNFDENGGSGIAGEQQTDYFSNVTVENLVYSGRAVKEGINNEPTPEHRQHLQELLDNIVNPLITAWGKGVKLTSGYRSNALNTAVGGSLTSAHSHGYAVDMQPADLKMMKEFKNFVLKWLETANNKKYDQFIDECSKNGGKWVHIGYKNGEGAQRHQKLYYKPDDINPRTGKNGMYYTLIYNKETYVITGYEKGGKVINV